MSEKLQRPTFILMMTVCTCGTAATVVDIEAVLRVINGHQNVVVECDGCGATMVMVLSSQEATLAALPALLPEQPDYGPSH